MHILFIISILLTGTVLASPYEDIASQYAPIVFQGQGVNPKADIFTRVDFDGDFNSYNNWKNLQTIPDPAVYYSVQETQDHLYITYGFFYPRDYSYVCVWKHCHENDFEGMRVTVNKYNEKVILLETFAHGKVSFDHSPNLKDNNVQVMIEGQGHGIYSVSKKKPERKTKIYLPSDYELLSLEQLWDMREDVGINKLWKNTFSHQGKRYSAGNLPAAFGGKKWGHGLANPPWAYTGNGKKARKGDWFIDPVSSHCEAGKCIDKPETEYLYNPFIR